jgi:hypothetical protein
LPESKSAAALWADCWEIYLPRRASFPVMYAKRKPDPKKSCSECYCDAVFVKKLIYQLYYIVC